uniref:Solute carrier family 43 member 3b n=1 Tax=Neogobius melanostomus TaxID=47308 RepID=A0A8C6TIN5_9GOBI
MLCLRSCSGARRWFTFVTGLVECLCFAGAVFGWASLVFVLKSEGYFSTLCVNSTETNGTHTLDCRGQDEQLSLVFTIASFMNNFLTLPNGFLFDHFGTTVARLFGIFLYTMGSLLVAFSTSVLSNLLFPAMAFLSVGGILFLMTNMQVGNLFGARRWYLLRASFLFLSACSVIHVLRTFFLLPRKFIPYPLPENYTYGISCGQSTTQSLEPSSENGIVKPAEETLLQTDNTPKGLQITQKSFRKCLLSRLFFWHLIWLSVMQLRHYLFIGTLNPMLQRLTAGEPSLVSQYTNAFAVTQLCGVLCAPWNGLIMDRHKGRPRAQGESERDADVKASVLSLALTAFQCLLFSLCATIPSLPLQYVTFILQVLNRSFLYGGNAAFLSVAFPSCHFGKLYGVVMALSALFSILQYPCVTLVKDVNIGLTILSLLAFIHPISVYLHCRSQAAQRADKAITADSR